MNESRYVGQWGSKDAGEHGGEGARGLIHVGALVWERGVGGRGGVVGRYLRVRLRGCKVGGWCERTSADRDTNGAILCAQGTRGKGAKDQRVARGVGEEI